MDINFAFLVISILKIVGIMAWIYGVVRALGHRSQWVKLAGLVWGFGIVQIALSVRSAAAPILSDFDSGLLFEACAIAMVSLG